MSEMSDVSNGFSSNNGGLTMNLQKMFDTVAIALRRQGGPSVELGRCKYRGQSGLKCAIGHLMPDAIYHKDMEGVDILALEQAKGRIGLRASAFFQFLGVSRLDFPHVLLFLNRLQVAHDRIMPTGMTAWRAAMYAIAQEYHLSPQALNAPLPVLMSEVTRKLEAPMYHGMDGTTMMYSMRDPITFSELVSDDVKGPPFPEAEEALRQVSESSKTEA